MNSDLKVIKKICKLNNFSKSKELNIVQWDTGEIFIDIRKWENNEPSRGISLTIDEAKKLSIFINSAISSAQNIKTSEKENKNKSIYDIDDLCDDDVKY